VGEGVELLAKTAVPSDGNAAADEGLITGGETRDVLTKFVTAIGRHRVFTRQNERVPA
jgi:hypothetical protein